MLGVVPSKFVEPIGGLIGGISAIGTGPTIAVAKFPGVGTPPVVPKASTIL